MGFLYTLQKVLSPNSNLIRIFKRTFRTNFLNSCLSPATEWAASKLDNEWKFDFLQKCKLLKNSA